MVSLQDQTILITGATSGIGAACARVFAQAGAKLVLAARRIERLAEQAAQLTQEFGVQIHPLQLDVRDRSAVESSLARLPGAWSQIDILVNNAGLSRGLNKLHEGDVQDWEEMLDTRECFKTTTTTR